MSLIFTPLGIRGVFGSGFDANVAMLLANVFGRRLGKGSLVVVGRDTRPSGEAVERAVVAGLLSAGVNVLNIGIAPTPAIGWATDRYGADGGVIISASHNPPEWNALKLLGSDGVLLHPDEMESLRDEFQRGRFESVPWNEVGREESYDVTAEYIEDLLRFVDADRVRGSGLKACLDVNGGAGAYVTPYLLNELGVRTITINSAPGIFVRELEPRPDTLEDLSRIVVATGSDLGLAHDTDADRLTLVTERGDVLPEDMTLALVVDYVLERRGGGKLVVNVASSRVFDHIARRRGAEIYRTPVGEAYVAHKMREVGATVGGEGSCGGVILPEFHLGRDGPLAASLILELMSSRGSKLSEIVGEFPKYHVLRRNFPLVKEWKEIERELIGMAEREGMDLDLTDGIRMSSEELWALVRTSKTEHKVRVLVEGIERRDAERLMEEISKLLS
ncbi:MAG: phosphoglucosamine mutase [Candidatus Korarchaeota archaeon NZ13-K]|nr:MAG: phosphoglucosamine mutase [Candidatus Korarchaeota archaeon NZ13-K]